MERDSLGAVRVPADALWGAQTQRAIDNFGASQTPMPEAVIHALGLIKASAARANARLGVIDSAIADAIVDAALSIAEGHHDDAFPVDVFQTGSGTSTNMNANEVIARLASRSSGRDVHPNDHVNASQSSNDVIPSAMHIGSARALNNSLLPALADLQRVIEDRARSFANVVKTGRTHLMDAVPITLGQELGAWGSLIGADRERLRAGAEALLRLPQGGTAVGSGLNAPHGFAAAFHEELASLSGLPFRPVADAFAAQSTPSTAVAVSGALKNLAVTLMKIANDLRWMNSGPNAGLAEIRLKAIQPGSSMMPGKVNPVVPEAVAMIGAQVMGNDLTVSVAAQSGNFQLNAMLPVIAHNLLHSVRLLAWSATALQATVGDFEVNAARLLELAARNPILATALAPHIGYDLAAKVAARAAAESRSVLEVAAEMTALNKERLEALLDLRRLAEGSVPNDAHSE